MASSEIADSQSNRLASTQLPKVNLLTMFRLGLFQMGLGIMSVLTLGVLNRVMIQELAIPATIVAATIATIQSKGNRLMSDFWTTVLDFAQATTARVGAQLLQDFGQVQASEKADGSLVTKADQWADQEIQHAIASAFPSHGILSEEGEHIFPGTEWCWVIDPLDGTTNFTRGIPIWAISLGLLYQGHTSLRLRVFTATGTSLLRLLGPSGRGNRIKGRFIPQSQPHSH